MKKRLLALLAACSMITAVSAGMIQTAYAAEPGVRIVVSDTETETQKVLTFYYDLADGVTGMNSIQGKLSFTGGAVTINSIDITIPNDYIGKDLGTGIFYFTGEDVSSADNSFATVTVTVPGDVDITASFAVDVFEDAEYDDYAEDIGTVTATIPANAATPSAPITVDNVDVNAKDIPGTYEHAAERADVYGVQVTVNEGDVVTGIKVAADDTHYGELNFGTKVSAGPIQFAVIFANESGIAQLPTLTSEMITAITE